MNRPDQALPQSLSLDAQERIDAICLLFEENWQAGQRPGLEDFLADVPPAEQATLLQELLRLEIHYRRLLGETPSAAEYLARLPGREEVIYGLLSAEPGQAIPEQSPPPPTVKAEQETGPYVPAAPDDPLPAQIKPAGEGEPEARPRKRAPLADILADSHAHLHERLSQAEQGQQAERRRRRWAQGLLVAVVLGALAAGAFAVLENRLARQEAATERQKAQQEAATTGKARDLLVSLFRMVETDIQGGNLAARQILADAEKQISVEFADQSDLRAELQGVLNEIRRNTERTIPAAMILEARGAVRLQSASGAERPAAPQGLLLPDERLILGRDAQVRLYFLADLHQEWLKPDTEATVGRQGCEPATAVASRAQDIPLTFMRLPRATFYMGWDGKKKGTKTEIKEDFEIAVHAVTQGQWEAVMGSNPSCFSRKGRCWKSVLGISDEELKLLPVEYVSWTEAQEFIKQLNEIERANGYLYRLPTEAEWEYACRGGAASEELCSYHFYLDRPTNDLSSNQANFNGNYPFGKAAKGPYRQRPTRVGEYPANNLGLCDMHGNIWQWCSDLWLPAAPQRVSRGGSWAVQGEACQAAFRNKDVPTRAFHSVGFRLARVPVR